MLFYLDENRKILDNNFAISHASALKVIAENPFAEWHDIDFSFAMGEYREGFEKVFYLEEDETIRIEYEEIQHTPIEPTQLDRIEEAINQSSIALSQTYTEIENRIIDNYTMSLVENNII